MANNFFKNGDKGYSENLNDSVLVGNAFDWTVSISLPDDTGGVFPDSSDIEKAKVCDVSATPNGNLSIGSTISNSSGNNQVYRLTVYPNFNRFGGFQSISLTADTGVTFYIANKGGNSDIVNNLDYTDLSNVPELQVLKQYDIVITIPSGKSVTVLEFVLQSSSADVAAEISQANVTNLTTDLDHKVDKVEGKGLSTNDFTDTYKDKVDDLGTWTTHSDSTSECTIKYNVTTRMMMIGISKYSKASAGTSYTLATLSNFKPISSFAQPTFSIVAGGVAVGNIRVYAATGKIELVLQVSTFDMGGTTVYGSIMFPY